MDIFSRGSKTIYTFPYLIPSETATLKNGKQNKGSKALGETAEYWLTQNRKVIKIEALIDTEAPYKKA
ncbi:hypothetical protein CREGCYN_16040 [Synechococcus sp. M16CYN]